MAVEGFRIGFGVEGRMGFAFIFHSLTLSACVSSLEPLGSMFLLNLFLCLTFSIPGCSWLMLVDTGDGLLPFLYWQEFTCGLLAV